ncbi:response regulator transcription factor, partial [Streptomyces sp. DH12]|uniref:response regulator transcription factor n=1 Tax=Streptomyces sp. DH12 TaxID=2857010 RepID=UPI001E2C6F27
RPHVVHAVDSLLAEGRALAESRLYRMVREYGLPDTCWNVVLRLRGGPRKEQQEPDVLPGLTEREREILELIGEGLTNRQIGQRLYLAEKTVKNHISRLLAKLGVERRIQAAVIATEARDRLRHDSNGR